MARHKLHQRQLTLFPAEQTAGKPRPLPLSPPVQFLPTWRRRQRQQAERIRAIREMMAWWRGR